MEYVQNELTIELESVLQTVKNGTMFIHDEYIDCECSIQPPGIHKLPVRLSILYTYAAFRFLFEPNAWKPR